MAPRTVWSSCVPLTIIIVTCLLRTGKAPISECRVNEKNAEAPGCARASLLLPSRFACVRDEGRVNLSVLAPFRSAFISLERTFQNTE